MTYGHTVIIKSLWHLICLNIWTLVKKSLNTKFYSITLILSTVIKKIEHFESFFALNFGSKITLFLSKEQVVRFSTNLLRHPVFYSLCVASTNSVLRIHHVENVMTAIAALSKLNEWKASDCEIKHALLAVVRATSRNFHQTLSLTLWRFVLLTIYLISKLNEAKGAPKTFKWVLKTKYTCAQKIGRVWRRRLELIFLLAKSF